MVGPESLLYSYSCKQVCCEQCLSRRNGSTIAIARFCRLSASNSLIEFASSGFKTKKHPFFRMSVFSFMVGPERIELSRHCCHQILRLLHMAENRSFPRFGLSDFYNVFLQSLKSNFVKVCDSRLVLISSFQSLFCLQITLE